MQKDLRQNPAPIQFVVPRPGALFAFGAIWPFINRPLVVPPPQIDIPAIYSDSLRTLARLEISDPSPAPPDINPLPSPAALSLADVIYPSGAQLLLDTLKEEGERRLVAERKALMSQVKYFFLGLATTMVFGLAITAAVLFALLFLLTSPYLYIIMFTAPFIVVSLVILGEKYFDFYNKSATQISYPKAYIGQDPIDPNYCLVALEPLVPAPENT